MQSYSSQESAETYKYSGDFAKLRVMERVAYNFKTLANSTVAAAALLLGKAFLALGLLIAFSSPLYGFDLSSNNMCYETDFNPEVKKSKYPIKMNC